ncbi:endonuclease V [Sorangium sp. So ce1128]
MPEPRPAGPAADNGPPGAPAAGQTGAAAGEAPRIAVLDVHYEGEGARAACLIAERWTDAAASEEQIATLPSVRPYRPGAFFERELPCLLEVLGRVRARPAALVIDGYVELDEAGAPGLGAHLHERLGGAFAVVGVAKTAFRGSRFAAHVCRGSSQRPLFVTARGLDLGDAARLVQAMHGAHRIPTLVARADALARGRARPTRGAG